MKKYGIIILAAGGSTRMGVIKQLLPYNGKTLIQRAVDTAQSVLAQPVVVVTGARNDIFEPDNSVYMTHNAAWKEGIASSIRCGLNAILKIEPALDAVLFLVCDQPHISANLLKALIEAHETGDKAIVASAYAGTVGIPALFHQSFFGALQQLKGDEGAKRIIMQNPESVAIVDFPHGEIDIDTAADYQALKGKDVPPV